MIIFPNKGLPKKTKKNVNDLASLRFVTQQKPAAFATEHLDVVVQGCSQIPWEQSIEPQAKGKGDGSNVF